MPVGSLPAAIIAAITTIVSLVVGFGILDEHLAGQIVAAAGTLISVAGLIANAIIHHGETAGAPPTNTVGGGAPIVTGRRK